MGTTSTTSTTSVSVDIYVDCSIEHAFRVFTEGIGSWWNPNHHLLDAPLESMTSADSPLTSIQSRCPSEPAVNSTEVPSSPSDGRWPPPAADETPRLVSVAGLMLARTHHVPAFS